MITGNETIKQLLNKRQTKDYNTKSDYFLLLILQNYLQFFAKNNKIELDNELVVDIAGFLEDCNEEAFANNNSWFFSDDFVKMFDKAKDEIWNGDYAWEGTTKFDFIKNTYEVEITDEQYHLQRKIDDAIDAWIERQREEEEYAKEYT